MTANTVSSNGSGDFSNAMTALASGYACGVSIGLVVTAFGRLLAFAHPASAAWLAVLVVTVIAGAVGFGAAERAASPDLLVLRRRFAGAMLLGGIALAIVLGGFSFLPSLQPGVAPPFLAVLGPAVAMLFFPVLLLAMGPRMAAGLHPDHSIRIAAAAALGAATGWLLVHGPAAPLGPAWAIATGALLAHAVGFGVALSARLMAHHKSIAGLVVVATVTAIFLIAGRTDGTAPLIIGSV